MAASERSRFRGCAAEACFKSLAVAKHRGVNPEMPTEYYVRYDDDREELRRDADILQEMWVLCRKILYVLAANGITLKWAQSTYRRRLNVDSDKRDSDERDSFCVDLTVLRGGKTYWIEFKYSGAAEWADILKEAEKSVAFWEKVLVTPRSWRLVHNLGGGALVAPCGRGTLISNFNNLWLEVNSEKFLLELVFPRPTLAQAAPKRRSHRPRVPETRTAEDFRALKAKRDRKRQRQDVVQTGPILKKPARGSSASRGCGMCLIMVPLW